MVRPYSEENGGAEITITRTKPEEIVVKLRQVEVLMGQGMPRINAIRQISVTEQTYYRWSADRTEDGRAFRTLNILDEHSRECLAIRVKRKLNSNEVIDALTDLFILRGVPAYIRSELPIEGAIGSSSMATAQSLSPRRSGIGSRRLVHKLPTSNLGHPGRTGTAKALTGE